MSMTGFDAHQMLMDMGICGKCHDHMPCGCETVDFCDVCGETNTDIELLHNDGNCFNCNTQLN